MVRMFLLALAALLVPESPIPAVLDHAPTMEKRLIETMPGGVALLDYDNDGRLDVFLAGAAGPNRLYRNAGSGKFEDVTEQAGIPSAGYSMGVAAADFDNDGHTDLFVAGVTKQLLLRNTGKGQFVDVTVKAGFRGEQPWSVAAGWFDYDRDGDLDLFVVRYVDWSPAKDRFCGDPVRKLRQYCHPRFFAPLANTLFRNRGDGTFEDVSVSAGIAAHKGKGMSLAFLDADQDGFPDVFVTNDTEPNFLFRNVEGKRFEEIGLAAGVALPDSGRAVSAMGVAAQDLDNDGRDDIAFTALMGETFPIFFATGKAAFADRTYPTRMAALSRTRSGWSLLAGDFDNDGRKDLFAANGDVQDNAEAFGKGASRQPWTLYRNLGKSFDEIAAGEAAFHRGAAMGDLNGDGALDVVVTRLGQMPLVLYGAATAANGWLRVRMPMGARVRVSAASGETQWQRIETACGYASSCEPVAHFGLGAAKGPFRVTVYPLTGKTREVSVDEARRVITP